jgi:hypothetical protein
MFRVVTCLSSPYFPESEFVSLICLFSVSSSVFLSVCQDIFSRLGSFVANVMSLFSHFYLYFTDARLATPFDT